MKFRLTIIALFGIVTVSLAQAKKWTLEECVVYAVENNLSVAQFELDLENAQIDKSDAVGDFLPTLNGNTSYSSNTGFSINPTTNLPTNTTQNNVSAGLTTAVTLFDGLRNVHRLNRAKINAIANQYRLEDLKDDIRLSVANSYLQVLSNKEALNVAKAQFKATEQDLNRINELVDAGVVPRGDLLDIQATAATQQQQIVNTEGNLRISKISLAQLLQIRDYEKFDVSDETFEIPVSDVLNNSPSTTVTKGLDFRNDIKLFKSEIDLAIQKGALIPTIGAFFNYNTRYSDVAQIPGPPVVEGGPPVFFTPTFT